MGSDRAEKDQSHRSSHTDAGHRHRHHHQRRHRSSRSRSPSPRRRDHRRREDGEERKERKERQGDRGESRKDRGGRTERGQVKDEGRERHHHRDRHPDERLSRIIDDGSEQADSHRETFAEVHPSRFESSTSKIPMAESLGLQSHVQPTESDESVALPTEPIKRDDWMMSAGGNAGDTANDASSASASADYFTDLGTLSRQKAPKVEKPNPDELKVSSREINSQFKEGKNLDEYEKVSKTAATPGGPGHQWRMMKLRRVYEASEDEGRSVEDIALERYGSMEAFNEARVERQFLDDQHGQRGGSRRGGQGEERLAGSAFRKPGTESPSSSRPPSRPMSRQSFRKPGEPSAPSTPQPMPPPLGKRPSSFKQSGYDSDSSSKPSTPIPSVFTPTMTRAGSKLRDPIDDARSGPPSSQSLSQAITASQSSGSNSNPPLSAAALNKLSAKVLRAEMMGSGDAAELREQLEAETARAQSGGDQGFSDGASHHVGGQEESKDSHVQVLPTLDARGRLYDVGKGKPGDSGDQADLPGNKRKSHKFETRDAKTGDLVRYNADDDEHTLADLVRQERFGAGSADQKSADAEMATRIIGDQSFKNSINYMDDNVERLARKKMKTDAMKRQFAVQGE